MISEVAAYPYGQRNDTLSEQVIVSLDVKAGEAFTKASSALTKADAAGTKADTVKAEVDAAGTEMTGIDTRLQNASRELRTLEKDVVAQSPRWRLIDRAAPELTKQLIPFALQKVDLVVCQDSNKPRSLQDEEVINTWASISHILEGPEEKRKKGARWLVVNGGMTSWLGTLGCAGIYVFVSSEAPEKTMEAAKVLGGALAKVLPASPNKMPVTINADLSRMIVKRGFESGDAPWHWVTTHPDEITVWIGPHP